MSDIDLDTAYEDYKAGKLMRKDLFRLVIDAIKELQAKPFRIGDPLAMAAFGSASVPEYSGTDRLDRFKRRGRPPKSKPANGTETQSP